MSDLPGRPNLGQLRRQARELLRAAADGEPSALSRIRVVSERVSLSAAQLATAREYGFTSWPALHAEVARRLAELAAGEGEAEARWSFAGAAAIGTAAGMLYPGVLVAGPGHAALDASVMPSGQNHDLLAVPPGPISSNDRYAQGRAQGAVAEGIIAAVALTDDQGTTYALHVQETKYDPNPRLSQERGLVSLRLRVDPVPARERGWLELRGQDGLAARLMPSPHLQARVSRLAPVPGSPAARQLSQQALELISQQFAGADQDEMERYCSAALARAAEIQQSGGPGATGDLPGQLARLCAVLAGHGPVSKLPRKWSSMIDAGARADGASQHLDLSVAFPRVDGTVVRIDSLVSGPGVWRMYMRAEPGWWTRSGQPVMSVGAEDDLGGIYLSQYDGGDRKELTLRFLPRLNPLARALTLTFTDEAEQVTIELRLP
jgi:hypothetical protein